MTRTETYSEDDILKIVKEHSKRLGGTITNAAIKKRTEYIGYGPMEQRVTVCEVVIDKE